MRLTFAALLAAFSLPTGNVFAQTIAGDYRGGGTTFSFANAGGYRFRLSIDVNVTSLGAFDLGGDGFQSVKNVGIFRANDFSAVVTTSLAQGTSATYVAGTVNGSRFNSVSAMLLANVDYYALVDNNVNDLYVYGTGAVVFSPDITWLGYTDGTTNSIFSQPIFRGGFPGNLGPNFIYSPTTTVPEPGTIAFVIPGLLALGLAARRRAAS
jgi:hypothetical protein